MKPAVETPNLETWFLVWLVAAVYLLVRHWRAGQGVGLVLTYVMSFCSIHWVASALYLLPWYSTPGEAFVAEGMKQAALAMVAFAFGGELAADYILWLKRRDALGRDARNRVRDLPEAEVEPDVTVNPQAANFLFVTGAILYFFVAPFAARVATLNAVIAAGSTLVIVAVGLKCWNAWHTQRFGVVWAWLGASAIFPFVTVATQGYLGYGMAAMVTIAAFVAAFYGPRWKVLVFGAVMAYAGLSVYVTYMRDRGEIRSLVWGGSTMESRVTRVTDTLSNIEWFDIYNPKHLYRIDDRLNQDYLVGAAVVNLRNGRVPYALGTTYLDALLSVVPRALWPDKPIAAGSGDLVTYYSGISFMGDTSVGIGQVMETYVNFGTPGVVIAFVVIGGLLIFIDHRSRQALRDGNIARFLVFYMPGLSLLVLGGSFVEVSATAAASWLVARLCGNPLRRLQPARSRLAPMLTRPVDGEARS